MQDLGIEALMVVLDSGDKEAKALWATQFPEYKKLTGRQLGQLRSEIPHFEVYDRKQNVFLKRQLRDKEGGTSTRAWWALWSRRGAPAAAAAPAPAPAAASSSPASAASPAAAALAGSAGSAQA